MAISSDPFLNAMANAMPPAGRGSMRPMYNRGDRVLVSSSTEIWIIRGIDEERPTPNGAEFLYQLISERDGERIRMWQNDIRSVEEAQAAKVAGKKAKITFESVIIEDEKREQILEALEQINKQSLIFDTWGFGETIEKGRGVSLLFYGEPGTGKTLMAQAIANHMGYKLTVISTADIESNIPGEAERNIRKHFKEAKGKKSIILFDECDSMIYTRQNVGPILSAQINELLSQIEKFEGLTIFTTNRLGTLDEAVNRRLALKLEFSMPNLEQRVKIWKRMFPAQAPLARGIKWEQLAEPEMTGGFIKNSVLRAARMAAAAKGPDDKKKIKMEHLQKAVKLEQESMEEFKKAREIEKHGYGYGTMDAGHGLTVGMKRQLEKIKAGPDTTVAPMAVGGKK